MPSTRERLLALVAAEPHLNQSDLAERLGVSRQRIKQLAGDEELTLKRGPRGVQGRGTPAVAETVRGVTGGLASIPPGTSPAVAVLLAAADLTARGYTVFLPVTQTSRFDLVAVDSSDKLEPFIVRKGKRAGGEIRYDDPDRGGGGRRALVLTDEPVQYEPALGGKSRR